MLVKTCEFCGKEGEFKHTGAFNIHRKNCEYALLKKEQKERERNIDHKNIDPGNGRKHVHEYRLLEEDGAEETNAIAQGYDRLCVGCGDVRKRGK